MKEKKKINNAKNELHVGRKTQKIKMNYESII